MKIEQANETIITNTKPATPTFCILGEPNPVNALING
jgi:hypothetical protein